MFICRIVYYIRFLNTIMCMLFIFIYLYALFTHICLSTCPILLYVQVLSEISGLRQQFRAYLTEAGLLLPPPTTTTATTTHTGANNNKSNNRNDNKVDISKAEEEDDDYNSSVYTAEYVDDDVDLDINNNINHHDEKVIILTDDDSLLLTDGLVRCALVAGLSPQIIRATKHTATSNNNTRLKHIHIYD